MSVPTSLKKTAALSFGVLFASSLLMAAPIVPAFAQEVGPQPPQPKPQVESPVAKFLKKAISSKKAAKETTGKDATKDGSDADSGNTSDSAANQSPDSAADPNGQDKPIVTEPPSATKTGSMVQHAPLLNQPPLTNARIEPPQIDDQNPPVLGHPKLDDPNNPLGFADAENKLKHYSTLIDAKRYNEAKPGLLQLRQWLVDLTEAHIGLFKTLNQIPSANGQAELEKELALQFAQLRDQAMLQTAKVYISERDYPKAVKELTEVVKSQPRSRIGLRSYEMLQEIGFTEKLQLAQ
jgi:hypothetical protein